MSTNRRNLVLSPGRVVGELPPGLPETDWCVASDQTRGGDVPQPDRWP